MRVQPDHWRVLLEFCESNREIITNKFSGPRGRADLADKWAELTALLNSLGLGEKTIEEWKKTLTDWKSKTKAKAAAIANYQGGTGGGPPPNITLTSFEERLLQLMGKIAIQGNIEIKEVGIPISDFKQAEGLAQKNIQKNVAGPSKRPSLPELQSCSEPAKKKKLVFIKVSRDSCQALQKTTFIAEKSNQIQPETILPAMSPTQQAPAEPEQEQQPPETPTLAPSSTTARAETSAARNTRGRRSHNAQMQQLQNMNNNILEVLHEISNNINSIADSLKDLINIFRNRE